MHSGHDFREQVKIFKNKFLSLPWSKLQYLSAYWIENLLYFSKLTQLLFLGQFWRPPEAYKVWKQNRPSFLSALVCVKSFNSFCNPLMSLTPLLFQFPLNSIKWLWIRSLNWKLLTLKTGAIMFDVTSLYIDTWVSWMSSIHSCPNKQPLKKRNIWFLRSEHSYTLSFINKPEFKFKVHIEVKCQCPNSQLKSLSAKKNLFITVNVMQGLSLLIASLVQLFF